MKDRMNISVKQISIILGLLFSSAIYAGNIEDEEVASVTPDPSTLEKLSDNFSVSTTFVNKHMWRAFPSGNAPCIEPLITYKHKGLSVNAWGCYAWDDSYTEFDLFVTYRWKSFQVGLFDYYCPRPEGGNDFSDFSTMDTRHLYEAQLTYIGPKQFPINIMAGCFVGGFDRDEQGDQLYSTYVEMNYTINVRKNKLKAEIGMTPFEGMYAKEFSVFNYGFTVMRDIKITEKWSIPSFYKLVYNKELDDIYFSVGFVFK